jgi:hypothetical protein
VIRYKTLNGTLKFEIESKGDSGADANNVQVTKLLSVCRRRKSAFLSLAMLAQAASAVLTVQAAL